MGWIGVLRFIMGRVLLQRFIDEVDPQAFLMVTKSSEVVGKGFMSYI